MRRFFRRFFRKSPVDTDVTPNTRDAELTHAVGRRNYWQREIERLIGIDNG